MPLANNAVAGAIVDGRPTVFTFLGIGPAKDYRAITRQAYALDVQKAQWERLPDVPGPVGRIAPTAQAVGDRVYVFGGYSVGADGTEVSEPAVDIYRIRERRYTRGADMPVPVDDTVSGLWRDRLIFLVSGWSTSKNVNAVQIYDPAKDTWSAATPIPGTPVFGHAGAIAGDAIVYCGGAKMLGAQTPKYGPNAECFRGDINPADPTQISWRAIAVHPGAPRYRAAAGPVQAGGTRGVMFAGGTANPYNYSGVGYNGQPSEPEPSTWIYDIDRDTWQEGPTMSAPSMDHRGLVSIAGDWWIVGGLAPRQIVSAAVTRLRMTPLGTRATPEQRYFDWTTLAFPAEEYAARRTALTAALANTGGGVLLSPAATGVSQRLHVQAARHLLVSHGTRGAGCRARDRRRHAPHHDLRARPRRPVREPLARQRLPWPSASGGRRDRRALGHRGHQADRESRRRYPDVGNRRAYKRCASNRLDLARSRRRCSGPRSVGRRSTTSRHGCSRRSRPPG